MIADSIKAQLQLDRWWQSQRDLETEFSDMYEVGGFIEYHSKDALGHSQLFRQRGLWGVKLGPANRGRRLTDAERQAIEQKSARRGAAVKRESATARAMRRWFTSPRAEVTRALPKT